MDHLQADIDSLESERGELKEKLKNYSKKALIEGISKSAGELVSCFISLHNVYMPYILQYIYLQCTCLLDEFLSKNKVLAHLFVSCFHVWM